LLAHPSSEPVDLSKDQTFKKVLLPLDGTPLGEQIIEPAIAVCSLFGGAMHLVRVVKPIMSSIVPTGMATMNDLAGHMREGMEQVQKQVLAEADRYLQKTVAGLRSRIPVTYSIVVDERPGPGILDAIKSQGADLVALATHGRSGLSRMFLGSVADKVLRGATVPMLVQKPKESFQSHPEPRT